MRSRHPFLALSAMLGVVGAVLTGVSPAEASGGADVFLDSAIEVTDTTVTLPLYEAEVAGETVWYIVTEASDGELADDLGVTEADKLELAAGTEAVQAGHFDAAGVLQLTATVDFTPVRTVVPTPGSGFPPQAGTQPGSIGDPGYSPLVELPDGTVLNAPHVARSSQPGDVHDALVELDIDEGVAVVELVDGFARDKAVKYISTDASDPVAAALEAATFAPALNAAPGLGNDGSDSSRASLAAITNGQTGENNAERQGLNSALLGEGDPLNLLAWLPNQGRYSPLWDVHLSTFADPADAELITRFADIEDLAEDGEITAPDGTAWVASNFVVNCPIIARV